MQLEAMASRPITSCLGEETNTRLTTTSFQVGVESKKVSQPDPPDWAPRVCSPAMPASWRQRDLHFPAFRTTTQQEAGNRCLGTADGAAPISPPPMARLLNPA